MNSQRQNIGFLGSLGAGLQWKLLLTWLLLMLVPVAVAAWPMNAALSSLLDHSVHAKAWGESFDALGMGDAMVQLSKSMPAIGAAAMAGFFISLLLSPFLTGMVVTSARLSHRPGFSELMHGGLREYWRMFRVILWSLVAWAVAIGIGIMLMRMAGEHAKTVVLESQADLWQRLAMAVFIVLLVIAHAIAESSRAQFASDPNLGSATRAWGRGLKMVFGRPLATFGMYLGVSIIGYLLVLAFGMLRVRMPAVGVGGVIMAFVLAQLVVLSLAWMRTARIHALASVRRSRRQSARLSEAPALG